MQENNFEKNVRSSLQDLQLEPAPPVWEAVEARIRPQQRRRRVLFWWLAVLLLVVGGGLWWHQTETNNLKNAAQFKKENTKQTVTHKAPATHNNQSAVNGTKQSEQTNSNNVTGQRIVSEKNNTVTFKATASVNKNVGLHPKHNKQQKHITETASVHKKYAVPAPGTNGNESAQSTVVENPISSTATASSVQNNLTDSNKITAGADKSVTIDSVTQQAPTPDAVATKQKKSFDKKAVWYVQAAIGAGTINTGLFNSNKSADAVGFASPGTLAPPPVYTSPQPPVYNWGLAASVGALWQKPLSARTKFSAGLLYRYNAFTVRPGRAGDTAVVMRSNATINYLISSSGGRYRNVYHQAEVPLAFGYQPLRKVNVWLWHGVSPAVVVAQRTVLFDAQNSGGPTADAHKTNRWQWVLHTSVQTSVGIGGVNRLLLGPSVRYQPSSFFRNQRQHLFEISLGAAMPLSHKKQKP